MGHQVTKGYFKNPEKTAEAFHNEWFMTGDVGQVNADGSLKIIDRAKNIFKLS
jgi:long-chain acyl-CoA synthetase